MRCGHGLSAPCATSRAGKRDASQRGPQRRKGRRGHQTGAAPSSTCRGQGTRRQANTESKASEARAQQTESILRRNLAQETRRPEGDASRPVPASRAAGTEDHLDERSLLSSQD